MERIQNILQRLQELYYSRRGQSIIDIDLMLDYTRVMYADLLEARKNFSPAAATEPVINQKEDKKELVAEPVTDQPHIITETVTESPEQLVAALNEDDERGISFEPPHPVRQTAVVREGLVEEEPEINRPVESTEIPAAVVPEQNPAAGDIRAGIGINDKYLFLNELFNNHKTEYEEAMDRLNRFKGYEEAYNWVIANTAVNNKWAEDDETVQSFFAVLKKHFSASR